MATLYIAEYAELAIVKNGQLIQAPLEPPLASQAVAIAAGSAQSAAFNINTRFVRLFTDTACGILFGTNPTALTDRDRMAANTVEYRAVPPGKSYKVAVIA